MKIIRNVMLGLLLVCSSTLFFAPGLYAMEEETQSKKRRAELSYAQLLEREEDARQKSIEIIAQDCVREPSPSERARIRMAAARLPVELHELIWNFATDRKKRFVVNHMEQLIPAVLTNTYSKRLFNCIEACKKQNEHHRIELEHAGRLPDHTRDPQLYYHGHTSINSGLNFTWSPTDPIPAPNREPLGIKQGQCCALHYTNGVTIFKADEATRVSLEKLSDEQLKFLVSLYELEYYSITLAPRERTIFFSLPKHIQRNIKTNYMLTNGDSIGDRAITFTLLAFMALVYAYVR